MYTDAYMLNTQHSQKKRENNDVMRYRTYIVYEQVLDV